VLPPDTGATVETGATIETGAIEEDFPNAAELALLEHVPSDSGIQASCAREAEIAPTGALAGVTCAADDGTTLFYYQFDSPDSMAAWYDGIVEDSGAARDTGDCAQDEVAESTWSVEDSEAGRVLCTPSSDGAFRYMFWTSNELGIGSVAATSSNSPEIQQALFELWSSTLGPI
jgi:hypothetical protein